AGLRAPTLVNEAVRSGSGPDLLLASHSTSSLTTSPILAERCRYLTGIAAGHRAVVRGRDARERPDQSISAGPFHTGKGAAIGCRWQPDVRTPAGRRRRPGWFQ